MTTALDNRIDQFSDLVTKGIEAWVEAGQLLCTLVEEDAHTFEKIRARQPWMTFDLLRGFERIGKKDIYPYLLLDQSPGARRLIELGYDNQKRFYDAEISVVVNRSGDLITCKKRLQELTRNEADRAFTEDGLRPIKEQREMMRPKVRIREAAHATYEPAPRPVSTLPVAAPINEEPSDSIDECLRVAQNAVLKVRQILGDKNTRAFEKHITNALNAIGGLRFELKEAS